MILANLTHACHPDKIYIIIIISSIFPSAIRDKILHLKNTKSRRRLDRIVVVSLLPMQSVSITTDAVVRISIRARLAALCDKVCQCLATESRSGRGLQHYVIKFVSAWRQYGSFIFQ
jgi:hypothetical protein